MVTCVKTLERNNLYVLWGLQFSHRMCVLLKLKMPFRQYPNNVDYLQVVK